MSHHRIPAPSAPEPVRAQHEAAVPRSAAPSLLDIERELGRQIAETKALPDWDELCRDAGLAPHARRNAGLDPLFVGAVLFGVALAIALFIFEVVS